MTPLVCFYVKIFHYYWQNWTLKVKYNSTEKYIRNFVTKYIL